jgi:4-hydroxy-tetrahydrodipicolinate reductase
VSETVFGVVGTGRLGTAVYELAIAQGHTARTYDSRRLPSEDTEPAPDVVVDCSAPAALPGVVRLCRHWRRPLVECVSGLEKSHQRRLAELGAETAVVFAPNLTLGNYLQSRALRCVAEILKAMQRAGTTASMPEVAILERHPARKAHRPSTTATELARLWVDLTGSPVADIASLRAGPGVSDHKVQLDWAGQALTFAHGVRSLDTAAAGAVGVGIWAVGLPAGTYPAHDVVDQMLAATAGGRPDGHEEQGRRPYGCQCKRADH